MTTDEHQRDADRLAFQAHLRTAKGAVREACDRHLDGIVAEHNALDRVIDELTRAGNRLAVAVDLVCTECCPACVRRLREALAEYQRERKP